jgi:hypothetical protein
VAARLYRIFPLYLTNGTIFEKKLLNIKVFFDVSLQLMSAKFLIPKVFEGDMNKNMNWYPCKIHGIFAKF